MTTDQLRARFLNFFKKRDHEIVSSDSLIPRHDPTLLFTGAGMNQFKDQFTGNNVTFKRAVTSQKCLRTADLDNVGRTAGHHTFFEMLGNFSFGDYFKKEAIAWAWEFLTGEVRLPKEKLWVSVYEDDSEAYKIWKDDIRVPQERIMKFGDKDNFWPSEAKKNGPNGPCGPCSEIFYDWGVDTGCGKEGCDPSCDCDRFVEVWNLVFTQYERKEGGVLHPLPSKNIDTGMGLERLAAVVQKKKTNFGIDTFAVITKAICKEINIRYGVDAREDSHVNAIADHIRAVTVAIFDGARPSNEGRGFVIRKLTRKASERARSLGMYEPFMYKIVPTICRVLKAAFPELTPRREDIASVVLSEEKNLKEVLNTVIPRLEDELAVLKDSGKSIVPGDMVFKYYDEKGLPLDLVDEKAKECGMKTDMEGFDRLLEEQKARSRDMSKVSGSIFIEKLVGVELETKFLHEAAKVKARVLGILKEDSGKTERVTSAKAGDKVHIALDATSFYGESGGQSGDRGDISGNGLKIRVFDAKRYEETIDHVGEITEGSLNVGDEVEAAIDPARRERIKRNHTATHLLQSALRSVLGDHVKQYGSLVEEDRLRFDFTHPAKVDQREMERIEEAVNGFINKDDIVDTTIMDIDEAKKLGAMALFGEKYKKKVMVRTIGDVSKELCGGTHVARTGEIAVFKIISESSIASGVRRIEALTSDAVYRWLKDDITGTLSEYRNSLANIKKYDLDAADIIKKIEAYLNAILVRSDIISKRDVDKLYRSDVRLWVRELKPKLIRMIDDMARELKMIKKKVRSSKLNEVKGDVEAYISDAKAFGEIKVISREIQDADMGILRSIIDDIKKKTGSAIVLLGSRNSGKANLVCGVTGDLVGKGFNAAKFIKKIAAVINGSGGGRPDMAQAGGQNPDKLDEALGGFSKIIEEETSK